MTGAVDLVLPVGEDAGGARSNYGRRMAVAPCQNKSRPPEPAQDWLPEIIELLRTKTAHDFTLYKQGTLQRRIERRMALAAIETGDMERYLELLRSDAARTRPARQGSAHQRHQLLPRSEGVRSPGREDRSRIWSRNHAPDQPLRIWIAGCSTGEETYSLAMLFREQIAAAKRNIKLQIFASDVDPDAVASAREGLYPETIEADVSPERLARFFTKEEHGYRVSPELRATVVFTVQDVLADPPFSRLDLVSCRNLLIYLRPEAQAKVISLFHFALREGGVLLLGSSETVGNVDGRFEVDLQRRRGSTGASAAAGRASLAFSMSTGDGMRVRRACRQDQTPGALAPGRARRAVPAAGAGDLCAGGGPDQPQARMPLFAGADRPLSARGAGSPHPRSAGHGAARTCAPSCRSAIQQASQENARVVVAGGRTNRDGDRGLVQHRRAAGR